MLWPWTWGCGGWQIVTCIFLPPPIHIWVVWKRLHQPCFKSCLFSVFKQGTPYLGDLPRSTFCGTGSSKKIASSKKINTFRKVLSSKCNLTLWTPLQNSRGPEVTYWKIPIFQVSGKCMKMQLHLASTQTHPKYKLQDAISWFDVVAKRWRLATCFQTNWNAKMRDLHLHPTPWHVLCCTTLTESAVHSLVHPCCASVKIGSNPTELRRFFTGPHCVGVERRSRAPWHRDELRDDWELQGNSSIDVDNRWQQQFVSDTTVVQVGCRLQVLGIIIWEGHFEWSICQTLFKSQSWNET